MVRGCPCMLLLVPVIRAVRRLLDSGEGERGEVHAFPLGAASGEDVHHPCIVRFQRRFRSPCNAPRSKSVQPSEVVCRCSNDIRRWDS